MTFGIAILMLLTATLANAEDDVFTFRPAHWVEGEEIEPRF